ncbi:hypothetical protein QTI66_25820 [Variovorax sp. J22R133]|uniref:hypothetical protein n=1 Tax=Variovorax brevis TaxID=3053503 RepID=UPI0025761069|nr:hypothetical protein [Variovorax sp. J22R133]MDM0115594.1 hypothetical protein [Variovorax sp. J22R133]
MRAHRMCLVSMVLTAGVIAQNASARPDGASLGVADPGQQAAFKRAPQKSNGSGIDVRYRVEGTPSVGKPTMVVIVLSGVTDPGGGSVWFTADASLGLDSSAAATTLEAGRSITLNVTVTPKTDGVAYLNVFTRQRGALSATSIAVQAGSTPLSRASGAVKDDVDGEKILPMQVK